MAHDPADQTHPRLVSEDETMPVFCHAAEDAAVLVFVRGHLSGRVIEVPRTPQHVLGRSPEADSFLNSPSVSKRHLAFHFDGTAFRLEDLGSTNGTRLNGRRLRPGESRRISSGDSLALADELAFFHEAASSARRLPPITLDRSRVQEEADAVLRDFLPRARGLEGC